MDFWKGFPEKSELLAWAQKNGDGNIRLVNAHMHTPYSFSAFTDITQPLNMAVKEGISVVGINDFYTTEGYKEWASGCRERKLFPLFNIEYISLNGDDQAAGIKVNDPNNPGRTYLSGKGLAYPAHLPAPYDSKLKSVLKESNIQVQRMCDRLNEVLTKCNAGFQLDYNEIKATMTKGMVRERHLAKALRKKINDNCITIFDKQLIYKNIFGGKVLQADYDKAAPIENEIRGNLLKAGGAAFIAESPKAFLDMETVCQMILKAGGIPTYPFLADDNNGNFTEFEGSKEKALKTLKKRNICSVEFITTRNSLATLEEYAIFFNDNGFVVTFGSEHNTPAMEPIELFARGNTPLSEILLEINYQGACITAAHQYLVAKEESGYLNEEGKPKLNEREQFVALGKALIEYQIKN